MKENLIIIYDMLNNVMDIDGDWEYIAHKYEDVMLEVMDILTDLIEGKRFYV